MTVVILLLCAEFIAALGCGLAAGVFFAFSSFVMQGLKDLPAADGIKAMMAVEASIRASGLEHGLLHLVKLRASQINGCAFCVQFHILQGESLGIPTDKLNLLVVWRESPQFSRRERAALAWTEALTTITEGVSDEVYALASAEFSEKELTYLTAAIASINVWNRFGAAYRWTPPARKNAVGAAAS